jgi:hypothetical protein
MFKKFRILTDKKSFKIETLLFGRWWVHCYITPEHTVNFWQWTYSSLEECKNLIEGRNQTATWTVAQ